jgi:hypothetical protein
VFRFPSTAAATAVLIVAAAGISGCAPQLSVTQTYSPTVSVSSLIVNDKTGTVSVSGGPGSEVSVTATISYRTSRPSITHTISGQALTLGYTGCTDCGVSFTVTVPRAASVTIHAHTGHITVAGLAGDVSVSDDTGKVTMAGLTGDVYVQDQTGSISGTVLSAMQASFQTGTGSIDVSFAAAPRQLSAVTGTEDVSLLVPSGTAYQVNASSKVGRVNLSVPQSPTATHVITATTTVGMVSVS